MSINTISYWFIEAVSSIAKNKKIFLSGIGVMTVTLLLITVFYICYVMSGALMDSVEESLGKVDVFLQDIDETQTEYVKTSLLMLDNVESVEYISKEDALKKAGEVSSIMTAGITENIYPASFVVTLKDLENVSDTVLSIRGIQGVGNEEDDVQVHDNLDTVNKIALTVRVLALTIFVLTAISSCFIMMNSIKLMLYSRRREISIMKYVGATDLFTKAPFVIEGLFIALISAGIVIIVASMICHGIESATSTVSAFAFMNSSTHLMGSLSVILLALALGIGTIGSSMSINKYLDV